MIGLALSAVVLVVLIQVISDEEPGFWWCVALSFLTSIAVQLLANLSTTLVGPLGIFLALGAGFGILGFLISAMFGVEIKRSYLISGIYFVIYYGILIAIAFMFASV